MRKSIFQREVHEELLRRMDKLTADRKPTWGVMTPAQMLHHVHLANLMMLGELDVTAKETLFTRTFIRYFILSGKVPSKKTLEKRPIPTMEELNVLKNKITTGYLETERNQVKKELERIITHTSFPARHPFMGKFSKDNWGQLAYSHLNYHLHQFGL